MLYSGVYDNMYFYRKMKVLICVLVCFAAVAYGQDIGCAEKKALQDSTLADCFTKYVVSTATLY